MKNDCERKSDIGGPKHPLEIEHASSSTDFQDTVSQMNVLHEIRIKNANWLITGNLNVNSLRNKFEMLEEIIKKKTDIFLISEIKLGSFFPVGQFVIKSYRTAFWLNGIGNYFAYVKTSHVKFWIDKLKNLSKIFT